MNKIWLSSYVAPSGNSGLRFSPIAVALLSDGSLFTSFAATEAGSSTEFAEVKVVELLCERQGFGEFSTHTDSRFLVDGWQSRRERKWRTRRPIEHDAVWQRIEKMAGDWLSIEFEAPNSKLIVEAKRQAARLIARGLPQDVGVAFVDDINRRHAVVSE